MLNWRRKTVSAPIFPHRKMVDGAICSPMIKNIKQIQLLLVAFAFVQGCVQNTSDSIMSGQDYVSREKAIDIAKEYLQSKWEQPPFDEHTSYHLYDETEAWNHYIKYCPKEYAKSSPELKAKVSQLHKENRLFWLIWRADSSPQDTLGVGEFIFIDRITGKVLYCFELE